MIGTKVIPYFRTGEIVLLESIATEESTFLYEGRRVGVIEDIVTIPQLWVMDVLSNNDGRYLNSLDTLGSSNEEDRDSPNMASGTSLVINAIAESLLTSCKVFYRIKDLKVKIVIGLNELDPENELEIPVYTTLIPQSSLKKLYGKGDNFKSLMKKLKSVK